MEFADNDGEVVKEVSGDEDKGGEVNGDIDYEQLYSPPHELVGSSCTNSGKWKLESDMSPRAAAPEKKLTIVALRLAILEKPTTGLGTLAFAWARVCLQCAETDYK